MLLPRGIIQSMAIQKLNLENEDDEEDTADITKTVDDSNAALNPDSQLLSKIDGQYNKKNMPGAGASNPAATRVTSFVKLNLMPSSSHISYVEEEDGNVLWAWMRRAATCFTKGKVAESRSTKRYLQTSMWTVLSMTATFPVWGFLLLLICVLGNAGIASIPAPVAMLNMINFCATK